MIQRARSVLKRGLMQKLEEHFKELAWLEEPMRESLQELGYDI